MALRRIERLLRDVRLSSNTQDIEAISDEVLVYYSNRVQSMLEDAIYKINSMNNIFMGSTEIEILDNTTEYDLPFDVYAVSAIKSVGIKRESAIGFITDPIPFISEKDSGIKLGYSLNENKIVFNFQGLSTYPVIVKYNRKIPALGKRFGATISAAGAGTVTVGATTDDILDFDDFFTTVDVNGVVKSRNNRILTYTKATGVLTFTVGSAAPVNGDYVIPGKYSTSHSQLPEECEKVFLEVLERRVAQRQSATDMNVISPLTDREFKSIEDVFAKGSDDNEVPPTPLYSEFI